MGEIRRDVSNLCVPGYRPAVQREKTRPALVIPIHGALSLYLSTQNLPDIPIADLCFDKKSLKKTPPDSDHVRPHGILDQSMRTPYPVDDEPDNEYDRSQFEVVHGHWVELRGAEEKWSALRRNFAIDMHCPCCDTRMHVIKDAAMVLCPGCRTIVPFNDHGNGMGLGVMISEEDTHISEEDAPTSSRFNDNGNGMGMGVKEDSLKVMDSNQSVHRQRAPTTKLGSRYSPKNVH